MQVARHTVIKSRTRLMGHVQRVTPAICAVAADVEAVEQWWQGKQLKVVKHSAGTEYTSCLKKMEGDDEGGRQGKAARLLESRGLNTVASGPLLRCVMLNAARLDYDSRINFDSLASVADVTRYEISDPSDVVARVQGADVVMNKEMPIPAELIQDFPPSVKLICEAGTGFNNIDTAAARTKGISVCNIPTYATEAMAHMAITLIMALSCSLVPQSQALHAGNRVHMKQCHLGTLPHFELTGKTVGLIGGLGTIGLRVAAMSLALGMRVVASSRSAPVGMRDDGIEVVGMDDLLARSDFVSLHCPLNAHTKGLIDASAIAKMKPTAFIINTARGSIIDQPALVNALSEKQIAGAALDVFGEGSAPPPALPDDSPLYKLENLILTPHIGWQRLEARQRVVEMCAENIKAFASGEQVNIVN
mmetsp:Transcript_57657/g.95325  ORF Transcript_57657/g.95325 Transcript_57657/m.95325 type:complete len:419 (-) Transcript_57657:127-1383(-)